MIAKSLISLHGLSLALKVPHLSFSLIPLSEIFDLIYSFPSLEDLTLRSFRTDDEPSEWTTPFTGTLHLASCRKGARRLLDLPGGLHFSKVRINRSMGDAESTNGLVSRCSGALESLHVDFDFFCMFLVLLWG